MLCYHVFASFQPLRALEAVEGIDDVWSNQTDTTAAIRRGRGANICFGINTRSVYILLLSAEPAQALTCMLILAI